MKENRKLGCIMDQRSQSNMILITSRNATPILCFTCTNSLSLPTNKCHPLHTIPIFTLVLCVIKPIGLGTPQRKTKSDTKVTGGINTKEFTCTWQDRFISCPRTWRASSEKKLSKTNAPIAKDTRTTIFQPWHSTLPSLLSSWWLVVRIGSGNIRSRANHAGVVFWHERRLACPEFPLKANCSLRILLLMHCIRNNNSWTTQIAETCLTKQNGISIGWRNSFQ
mmetsp:Transcript_13036/g.25081  ORF Transcript_13036/g.25081 Transcript_13036/m.25081 type:complete len:223 (+) Transcript_13036:428-1096(+)